MPCHAQLTTGLVLAWAAGWLCSVSTGFNRVCLGQAALPLWRMLSGQLPGFVQHGELLLRITVAALPGGGGRPAMGPLVNKPATLSSPLFHWGAEAAHQRLWGTLGFRSRRLPATSGQAVGQQLEAVRAARLKSAPWLEEWMERFQRQLNLLVANTWLPPSAIGTSLTAGASWLQTAGLVLAAVFGVLLIVNATLLAISGGSGLASMGLQACTCTELLPGD